MEEKVEKLSLTVHTRSLAAHSIQAALPVELTSTHTTKKVLDVPAPLEQLDVAEYPYIQFWYLNDWTHFKSKKSDAGKSFHKLQFIEDEDGEPVSPDRLAKMTKTAKELWNELYSARSDPATWSKKLHSNSQYFARTMQLEYPEFRYCDGNWKADAFATIRFPDWNRADRSSGVLSREFKFKLLSILSYRGFYFLGAVPSFNTKKPEASLHYKKRKSTEKDKLPKKKKRSSKELDSEKQAAPCSVKKEPVEVIEINSESELDPIAMPTRKPLPPIATGEWNLFPLTSSHQIHTSRRVAPRNTFTIASVATGQYGFGT